MAPLELSLSLVGKSSKKYLIEVINSFSDIRTSSLHWLNTSNIVLIPKKDGAQEVSQYRPVSLVHGVANFFFIKSAGT